MAKKIKKVLATVACMALSCVAFVGCDANGEPEWWTKVKDWFNGTETSAPIEDEEESGKEDEKEDEGSGEEGDETSTPEEEESSTHATAE